MISINLLIPLLVFLLILVGGWLFLRWYLK
ncbi:Uncharacterised protein [Staphylococcus intermedius NCTC 11048]|uniref:Uncharacterized protein n=1 Tax=Staphylococcus intermedius NCTC 11048 TaxID=1141106 RepID=A0A380G9R2_STAIN|nr:Uncharacterised protein [Staphylococcus intermedius NCTC 11048]